MASGRLRLGSAWGQAGTGPQLPSSRWPERMGSGQGYRGPGRAPTPLGPSVHPPPMGGMTWSRSFMLVLFQTFLMMARSSSLACSKLPGAADRPGQQHLTGPPLAQQMVASFPLWWRLPWAQTLLGGGGDNCCAPGAAQPQVTFAPGLGFQHPEWPTAEAVPSCPPCRPRTVISPLHTRSVLPPPGSSPGARPRPLPDPGPVLLALPRKPSLPLPPPPPQPICPPV